MTDKTTEQPDSQQKIRILIADDHPLVRDGIRARLELNDDLEIVAEAADGNEAVKMAREHKPDIVMLDISMPNCNGFDAARMIREEKIACHILFLSMHDNPEYVQAAMKVGANGFLLKDVNASDMTAAISAVAQGKHYFSQSVSLEKSEENTNPYHLTDRELDVLKGIAEGKANKEIASDLGIGVRTVESHRQRMREKIGGGNAAQLTHLAMEMGLIAANSIKGRDLQ